MSDFLTIHWNQQALSIEAAWVGVADPAAPVMVFVHCGLGSVAMWNDFPHRLCTSLHMRGLVYSRPGFGRSSPLNPALTELPPHFMHQHAHEVLPLVLEAAGIAAEQPIWLVGHNEGATMALLHAAQYPERMAGVVALAPRIVVEGLTQRYLRMARQRYEQSAEDKSAESLRKGGGLHARMALGHDQPEAVFTSWNQTWLSPEMSHWSVERELSSIACPVLAVQGLDDEFGTLEQIRGVARRVPTTRLSELMNCGHEPHLDQPEAVLVAARKFVELYGTKTITTTATSA